MLNKYIIDAKKDVLEQFDIDPSFMGSEPLYFVGQYVDEWIQDRTENKGEVLIKFYQTARGDKRMSIPNLRKCAEVGDYVWFTEAIVGKKLPFIFYIHIGKELPADKKEQCERRHIYQLQVRYG